MSNSSVYQANPRNDTERPHSTIVRPGARPPPPARHPPNAEWMKSPSVAVVGTGIPPVPCRPIEMKRSPNFRSQEFSGPRLHGAGCNLPLAPMAKQKTRNGSTSGVRDQPGAAGAVASLCGVVAEEKLVPTRVAPAPPSAISAKHPETSCNGVATLKRPPKHPLLPPQHAKAPPSIAKMSNAMSSSSIVSRYLGVAPEELSDKGADEGEFCKSNGSPTVPPPDPPDSRHRFYSSHHRPFGGQASLGVGSHTPFHSKHLPSSQCRSKTDIPERRTENGCSPRRADKPKDPRPSHPVKGTSSTPGAVQYPNISGHHPASGSTVPRSQNC